MNNISLSVIIPVYNAEKYLKKCLDSLTKQTWKQIEIICVDDGSTDNSIKILLDYARQDQRFKIIHQDNRGPGAARNRGLQEVQGEYLIFLDADDWFETDFLEKMVENAQIEKTDITICRADEFDINTGRFYNGNWMLKSSLLPSKTFSPKEIQNSIFQFTYGMAWDKLFRSSFVKEGGFVFPELHNSEDLVFVYKSVLCAKKIGIVDEVLLHHRINRFDSVSNSRSKNSEDAFNAFACVQAFLIQNNMLKIYERSYINWSMDFLIWHVCNMDDVVVRRNYFYKLKTDWFPKLNFSSYPWRYFYKHSVYLKYLLIKYSKFSFFNFILKSYKYTKSIARRF